MQTKYLDIDGHWGIILCFDLHRLDEYEMRSNMMSFGMRGPSLDKAVDTLLFNKNTYIMRKAVQLLGEPCKL